MVRNAVLEERMTRMAISMYGYLKRVAAVHCVQHGKVGLGLDDAMKHITCHIQKLHEPLAWESDLKNG